MVSTYTPNVGLERPANNDYVNDWDLPVNADLTTIDKCFGGYTVLNPTGLSGTQVLTSSTSVTPPLTFTAQWQVPNFIVGTSATAAAALTANINYQIPSGVGGMWSVYNNTTGAFSVTFSSGGGGATVVLPQGFRTIIICDGANVSLANNGIATAAGANTQVQFNSSGVLAGSNNLTWGVVGSSYALEVGGQIASTGSIASSVGLLVVNGSGNFVGFTAPSSAGNFLWTLPPADGMAGQYLTTNGGTILSWSTPAGGVSLSAQNTWTGKQSFFGVQSALSVSLTNVSETTAIYGTSPGTSPTLYLSNGSVHYFNVAATSNWTTNITLSPGTTLLAALSVGQSLTLAMVVLQGSTAYYSSSVLIDGSAATVYWQGGTAPTTGHANGLDVYTYTIIRVSGGYTCLASLTQF